MRTFVLTLLFLAAQVVATGASLRITAPEFHDQPVIVFRYLDLFTLRTEVLASTRTDAQGSAHVNAEAPCRTRGQLRLGEARTDLYPTPEAKYDPIFQRVKGNARSI